MAKKFTMLYKWSSHGWDPKTLHNKCDNRGPTLTVMKSKVNKIFGGFAFESWQSHKNGEWKNDSNVFIFSLDTKKLDRPYDPAKALFLSSL